MCNELTGRKKEIVEAAIEVINRSGLKDLTIYKIAKEIGVVPSALYRHFKSKEEILDGVLSLVKQRFKQNIKEVREEHISAISQLDAILTKHVKFIKEKKALPRILFSEEIIGDSKKRRKRLAEIIKEQVNTISEIIKEGQRQKEIREDIDPVSAALMFLGIVQPAAILWHASGGEFDLTEHAKNAWKIFKSFLTQ